MVSAEAACTGSHLMPSPVVLGGSKQLWAGPACILRNMLCGCALRQLNPAATTAGIINFEGEREMWAAVDEAAASRRQLARFGIGISLLVAAAFAASTRMRADRPSAAATVPAMVQAEAASSEAQDSP